MANPGDASYTKQLESTLLLRWSTEQDRAGLALTGALAFGDMEGAEDDYAVRSSERWAMDEYPLGSSTSWAICVDQSLQAFDPSKSNPQESPYVSSIRQHAESAESRVVAVVLLAQHTWSFEGNAATVTCGRITLSACKTKYRGTPGLMSGLFDMVHARSDARGDVMLAVNGIPAYYRKKGYEYGVSFGKGMITHFGQLPLPSEALPALFSPASDGHDPRSLDILSPGFSARQAEPKDAPRLLELHEMPRRSANQWVAYNADELEPYTRWLSGSRPPPFDDPDRAHHLDLPMREPVSVLEQRQEDGTLKIVAAMVIHPSKNTRQVVASRVLFDEAADLATVTRELLLRAVQAILGFWRSVVAQQPPGQAVISSNLSAEPSSMLWFLPKQHPISLHLVGQELAQPLVQNSLVMREDWQVKIPSMAKFLQAIAPALQARLDAARPILGASFSLSLRLGCYDTKHAGADIRIERCRVASISERVWTTLNLDRALQALAAKDGINVIGTYASLVALLMGYKSRVELLDFAPDFQLAPETVVACDVLFPKSHPSFPAYL